jgi:hypothetical protein
MNPKNCTETSIFLEDLQKIIAAAIYSASLQHQPSIVSPPQVFFKQVFLSSSSYRMGKWERGWR